MERKTAAMPTRTPNSQARMAHDSANWIVERAAEDRDREEERKRGTDRGEERKRGRESQDGRKQCGDRRWVDNG